MTIKNAIDHFKYKLSNVWKATDKDAEAITAIIKFTNQQHKEQLKSNELFAKMYIMVFSQYLERYKADIYDDIPQKELHKLLGKDIGVFVERFTNRLNEREKEALFNDLGIKLEHPALKADEHKEKELKALKHALKDETKAKQFYENVWTYEDVKEN